MDKKINGHTAAFLKRQAKNIKKVQGISYRSALEQASINAGFSGWNNFVNLDKASLTGKENSSIIATEMPVPANFPNRKKEAKMNPYRKLLIAAINELLKRDLISLIGADDEHLSDEKGHVFLDLFGYPSVILWSDIGFQELRISVWWKYNHSLHPQAYLTSNARESFNCATPLANRVHYKKFVGITASGWLERKEGKYLQGEKERCIFEIYTRKGEKEELERLPLVKPKNFKAEGKFHM